MNTAALKAFAPAVRRDLIEAVDRKLDVILAAQTPDYRSAFTSQVTALAELARADRIGLVERVAYTWFNRLTALRYLDARGWHPFRARVITASAPSDTQPEVLKLTRDGALPTELARHTAPARLNDLLDARLPSANPQGEVYRDLVLAACRFYHGLLPDLFEKLDDATELLLPDDLLTEHSVVAGFRTEITDEDCADVEVLGWLYQFYIVEKKDAVMARKATVPSADIPAVTQLFTPHWIVRYLVENSLGRLWLLNRPRSQLRQQMPYFVETEPEADFPRVDRPDELRVLDPAVGSGHMLTYAFDLLYAIYEEEGYAPSAIPGLILKHNLYGIDIDQRAAQLAELALVLKAREKGRRFFEPEQRVRPNVIALQDVRFDTGELGEYVRALNLGPLFDAPVLQLLGQFEQATTFGSLIEPGLGAAALADLRRAIESADVGGQLLLSATHGKVLRVLAQAEYLTSRYYVVVANPPYMGSRQMNPVLKDYVEEHYQPGKADLCTSFSLRLGALVPNGGFRGMITPPNWMFISSFESFRKILLSSCSITSLVENGRGVWGPDFGSVAFVVSSKSSESQSGVFRRLFKRQGEVQTQVEIEANFHNLAEYPVFRCTLRDLLRIPGSPIAYWISEPMRKAFERGVDIGTLAQPRQGMASSDNERFLRRWFEVSENKTFRHATSRDEARRARARWFPYNKGGAYRKWFGNNEWVVNWENDGQELIAFASSLYGSATRTIKNISHYFKESGTWSALSISGISLRYNEAGFIFDTKGQCIFAEDRNMLFRLIAMLNSNVATELMRILAPTLDFNSGTVARTPFLEPADPTCVSKVAESCVIIAGEDWDSFETSWGYRRSPLLPATQPALVRDAWGEWSARCQQAIARIQALEAENNRVFIDAYGLNDELTPDVPDDQITLARADRRRDAAALLSYAVGCMMGRYSLDLPGLVLADAGDTLANYLATVGKPAKALAFAPDADGIIPILDREWFEDDVVARVRDFLRVTYGEATLRENVRWLEESLGKDLRKYFMAEFYKDHLQTYKKRPIYWLVQSPKKGFSVLIYLHRYTRDTLNVVLNRYLREYQGKLRSRLAQLTQTLAGDTLPVGERTAARKESDKLTKMLHECEEWERQALLPLAQQRIELDLDDGVKVNYLKLADVLAPIPGLALADE